MKEEIDFRKYFLICWKWKYLIISLAFLGLGIAWYFSQKSIPIYEADISIFVRSISTDNISPMEKIDFAGMLGVDKLPQTNTDCLLILLDSKALAKMVVNQMNLKKRFPDWKDLTDEEAANATKSMLKPVKIERGGLMTITVASPDRSMVAEIVNCYARLLSDYWNRLNETENQRKLDYLIVQIPKTETELKLIENKIKFTTENNISPELRRNALVLNSVLIGMKQEYEKGKIEKAKEIVPFTIIDEATQPSHPLPSNKTQQLLIGFILGLSAGLALSFSIEGFINIRTGKQ